MTSSSSSSGHNMGNAPRFWLTFFQEMVKIYIRPKEQYPTQVARGGMLVTEAPHAGLQVADPHPLSLHHVFRLPALSLPLRPSPQQPPDLSRLAVELTKISVPGTRLVIVELVVAILGSTDFKLSNHAFSDTWLKGLKSRIASRKPERVEK